MHPGAPTMWGSRGRGAEVGERRGSQRGWPLMMVRGCGEGMCPLQPVLNSYLERRRCNHMQREQILFFKIIVKNIWIIYLC